MEYQEFVKQLLEYKNFKELTPIQKEVIPLAIKGNNVIAKSKTGSGKTHAFLIPIMEKIDTSSEKLQVIILSPTRELATQIYNMASEFCLFNKDLKIKLLVGGIERKRDESHQKYQIIIGTPGRVKDYTLTQAKVNINSVKTIVLDEIDMIFELNFMEDVDALVSRISNVQILSFSATINSSLKPFIKKYLTNAKEVAIDEEKTSSNVTFYAIDVKHKSKIEVLEQVLKCINPFICLIFASRKEDVIKTYQKLSSLGLKVAMIHGDLEARERKSIYKRVLNEEFTYVVCSDIASRGLDINSVTHVISLDFPKEKEYFFHRAGRTGRMNQTGLCITLYDEKEKGFINTLKNEGVNILKMEIKNNQFKEVKEWKRKPSKNEEELNKEIKITVSKTKSKKVKPNYKKKVKEAVSKVKRKYKRAAIEKNVQKQLKEKNIARTKALKKGEN